MLLCLSVSAVLLSSIFPRLRKTRFCTVYTTSSLLVLYLRVILTALSSIPKNIPSFRSVPASFENHSLFPPDLAFYILSRSWSHLHLFESSQYLDGCYISMAFCSPLQQRVGRVFVFRKSVFEPSNHNTHFPLSVLFLVLTCVRKIKF